MAQVIATMTSLQDITSGRYVAAASYVELNDVEESNGNCFDQFP